MIELKTMDSSILSFIILIFIYINVYNRSEKVFLNYRLYIALVQTNMLLIVIDILGWVFNGLPGPLNMAANTGFNLLLYIFEPVGPVLWILYSDFQVYHDDKRIRKTGSLLLLILFINAIFSVISLYSGWFFSVDPQNIYHRGDYFWVHVALCYVLLVYPLIFIYLNRNKLEKRYYNTLLLFFIPQAVGTIIQMLFYGVSYNWSGMMLSLLIIYFNIQDHGLTTDYLTGVYNRRLLDKYIKTKIRNSSGEKTFSSILIDLNNFKHINDTFGHDTGDEALQNAAKIIKKCLRQNDFIARYGGDEFFVIMDISSKQMLEVAVNRISKSISEFNIESKKPYSVSFSIGYDVYDTKSKMKPDDFFKHIDRLMYIDKSKLKEEQKISIINEMGG